MKTTEDRDLEGEERARMAQPWDVYARIEPKHERPEMRTLTLGVSDGPECYVDFDPAKGIANIGHGAHDRDDDDSDGTLLHAIGEAATSMAEAAVIDEASTWIREHDRVFVVMGATGKDCKWMVRAFLNEQRAEQFRVLLNAWMIERGFDVPDEIAKYDDAMKLKPECPDKRWRYNHATGTSYSIEQVPVDMAHAWSD